MNRTAFLFLLLFSQPAHPAEETKAAEEPGQPETEQTESTPDEEETAPRDGNLHSRALGDAFRNFTPSEEISADNAVSFPVDI